jgi:hypothetical protein
MQTLDDEFIVRGIDCRYDHEIRVRLVEHCIEVRVCRAVDTHVVACVLEAPRVDIAQANIVNNIAVIVVQVLAPEPHSPDAGADERNSAFPAGTEYGCRCEQGARRRCRDEVAA